MNNGLAEPEGVFYFFDSGGDLHEQEEDFFAFVESRVENTVEEWVQSLNCPIIRVDGTKTIEENITFIIENLYN